MGGRRVIGIHQPEYLPWMGFLNKLSNSNTFVILDNVQYARNYFQNRNRIRTATGWSWLTVPVKKAPMETPIRNIEVDNSKPWGENHMKGLSQNYSKTPHFHEHEEFFHQLYSMKWSKLAELNLEIIRYMAKTLNIQAEIILASKLKATGTSSELLLRICKELGAETYVSGRFGKAYLNERLFEEAHIRVVYQDFHCPTYSQVYEPFIPDLAGVDLLFNRGVEGIKLVREGWQLES